MTVLTMPAQPGQDTGAALRPVPWRRMVWVTWRQHRATIISVARGASRDRRVLADHGA